MGVRTTSGEEVGGGIWGRGVCKSGGCLHKALRTGHYWLVDELMAREQYVPPVPVPPPCHAGV